MAGALATIVSNAMPFDVSAKEIPPARVVILEYQHVMSESAAAIDIKAQIEKQRLFYRDEMNKHEQELRAAEQEILRQSNTLSREALAQMRRELRAGVTDMRRGAQAHKRELDQAYRHGMNEVERAIAFIITELAKEKGFNLVLPHARVMFLYNDLNITDEVMSRINARLSSVKVPLVQN